MALFGCKFGNVVVGNNGGEIECTVEYCESCKHNLTTCPYDNSCGCIGGKPQKCPYFIPIRDHLYYQGCWYN
jgi:hypothetical protein